jgi:hypothetical protein
MTMDNIGNIYITGYFFNVADNNPGSEIFSLISIGFSDAFIIKINNNGNFIWAKQMGSKFSDGGNSIFADVSGNIYTTGRFQDIADLNPNLDTYNVFSN